LDGTEWAYVVKEAKPNLKGSSAKEEAGGREGGGGGGEEEEKEYKHLNSTDMPDFRPASRNERHLGSFGPSPNVEY
jgi:hypothetical protein